VFTPTHYNPDTEDLPLIAKWPEIGLGPVTTPVPIVGDISRYCIIVTNVYLPIFYSAGR